METKTATVPPTLAAALDLHGPAPQSTAEAEAQARDATMDFVRANPFYNERKAAQVKELMHKALQHDGRLHGMCVEDWQDWCRYLLIKVMDGEHAETKLQASAKLYRPRAVPDDKHNPSTEEVMARLSFQSLRAAREVRGHRAGFEQQLRDGPYAHHTEFAKLTKAAMECHSYFSFPITDAKNRTLVKNLPRDLYPCVQPIGVHRNVRESTVQLEALHLVFCPRSEEEAAILHGIERSGQRVKDFRQIVEAYHTARQADEDTKTEGTTINSKTRTIRERMARRARGKMNTTMGQTLKWYEPLIGQAWVVPGKMTFYVEAAYTVGRMPSIMYHIMASELQDRTSEIEQELKKTAAPHTTEAQFAAEHSHRMYTWLLSADFPGPRGQKQFEVYNAQRASLLAFMIESDPNNQMAFHCPLRQTPAAVPAIGGASHAGTAALATHDDVQMQ